MEHIYKFFTYLIKCCIMGLSQHNGRGEAAERLSYLQTEVNNESLLTQRVSIST